MCKDIKKEYIYESVDGKTMKLEFYSNRPNNIKMTIILGETNTETEFDLETIEKVNKKIEKYIRKQNKIKNKNIIEDKIKECQHKNTERTHPYGWLACKDCGKLIHN